MLIHLNGGWDECMGTCASTATIEYCIVLYYYYCDWAGSTADMPMQGTKVSQAIDKYIYIKLHVN